MRSITIILAAALLAAGCGTATAEKAAKSPAVQPTTFEPTAEPVTPEAGTGLATGPPKRLTDRRWKLIARDPDSSMGERYIVHCVITQSDAATGSDQALADCGGVKRRPSYGYVDYPTNTILSSDEGRLEKVAEDDLVTIKATVLGSIDYETQIGGETTAPALQVDALRITGQQDG
jgi:hypothetical protein